MFISLLVLLISSASAHVCEAPLSLVAEKPIDAMGAEFAQIYGEFVRDHRATPDNMLPMAEELFGHRLALAQKYGTYFGTQMIEDREGLPYWRARLEGLDPGPAYSYGIAGVPRADVVWSHFRNKFFLEGRPKAIEALPLPRYQGPPLLRVEAVEFRYPEIKGLVFSIYKLKNGSYYIKHADGADVPKIMDQLENLWRQALSPHLDGFARRKALHEWEWLWFWTNPFGRAGASIGSTLSLVAERRLIEDGVHVRLRRDFYFQDLEALSRPLEAYLKARESGEVPPHLP